MTATRQAPTRTFIAAVGPAFHPDWAVALRGMLFVEDRNRARKITGRGGNSRGHCHVPRRSSCHII